MPRRGRATAPLLLIAACLVGCKRQHHPVDQIPELSYPSCPEGVDMTPVLIAEHKLRSGLSDTRKTIAERYRIEKRGCLHAVVTRQEWPMQIDDVEVLYNESLEPLRIWHRRTMPGSLRPDGNAHFKRLDLRTPQITLKHREDTGKVNLELLKGPGKPVALIGPGRGLFSMWIRRARLAPGQKTREMTLDFRGVEKVAPVTLQRLPDKHLDWLGRSARVYTILGREIVFADDDDTVIGDLAGLVLDEKAPSQAPRPMPTFEPLDPVNTP